MKECNCSICFSAVDGENADILTVGALGDRRYLCAECASLFDTATRGREFAEIEEAFAKIGERMEDSGLIDEVVINQVGEILEDARARAEEIRFGTYDFTAEDEEAAAEAAAAQAAESGDAEVVIEDEYESAEERLHREQRERRAKILDIVTSCLCGAMLIAAVIFLILRFT